MTKNAVDLGLSVAGLALSTVSVLLALNASRALALLVGLIAGVLLAPLVKRAAAWLARYLGG